MSKLLIILVSGLLIFYMAGSAIAYSTATVLMPNNISITPDGSSISSVDISILAEDPGASLPQDYTVQLESTEGLEVYLGDSKDINVGSYNNWASSVLFLDSPFQTTAVNQYHTGRLYIRGTGGGTVTVYVYNGNTPVGTKTISAESLDVSVPEFPVVAAPIAGIIGLLFVFGRRKEGL